jgi:hypothetical protein
MSEGVSEGVVVTSDIGPPNEGVPARLGEIGDWLGKLGGTVPGPMMAYDDFGVKTVPVGTHRCTG